MSSSQPQIAPLTQVTKNTDDTSEASVLPLVLTTTTLHLELLV